MLQGIQNEVQQRHFVGKLCDTQSHLLVSEERLGVKASLRCGGVVEFEDRLRDRVRQYDLKEV